MDLTAWVSDHALKVRNEYNIQKVTDYAKFFSMSERSIVDYVVAIGTLFGTSSTKADNIASSAQSTESLFTSLSSAGLPDTPEARQFVSDLYNRVPRKAKSSAHSARRAAEKETTQLQKKNASFGLLLDDEDDLQDSPAIRKDKRDRKDRKSEKRTRRKDVDDAWQSDEEDNEKRRKRIRQAEEERYGKMDEDDDADEEERERLKDLKERDEFAERLKAKDSDKTRKLVEDRSSRIDPEIKRRRTLADDADARQAALPDIRKRAREEYLNKRAPEQIALLRKQVEDDEAMFRDVKLTRRERAELEYNKEVLRLAEERMRIDDKVDGYMMPDDYITEKGKIDRKKKEAVLYQRYEDAKEGQFVTDQDTWEEAQTQKSQAKVGARDRVPVEDEYEFVFDESQRVAFIMDHQTKGDRETRELEERISAAERKAQSLEETRKSLPIYQLREELLQAIADHQVIIIVGETGSGKTTQIPQYLHEAGYTKNGKKVACTQPRRVAAMSVAARVAEEVGVRVGDKVGYSIRFEDSTSDKTVIKYMTDGMLLREFLTEPDLATYSALMIDEAHERTLHTDILFGLVKDIARFRPDLKLLISSATLDAQKFSDYFDNASIFHIPGRMFPVDIHYTQQPEANYLHAAITTIFQIHTTQGPGDILVFFTGQEEIESASESLTETARVLGSKIKEMIIAPIYANLPSDMQSKIFEPTPEGARKVVLATNIAETSITIDGIKYVIDPGFVKQNQYNPKSGMESLVVVPCSRAAANQRAGRAGRVGPGKCFRLYTRWAYQNELDDNTTPEIQRTNLGNICLTLKSLGINDLISFDFMDPPPHETLIRALTQLYALGAFNHEGELTKLGRRMAEFPTDPSLSKAIISSENYGCTDEVLSIISMLSESSSIFYRPKDKKFHADKARQNFVRPGGDHMTLLNVWNQWVETNYSVQWCYENFIQVKTMSRVRDIRDQLAGLCERVELVIEALPDSTDITPVQKALTSGFFMNTARLGKGGTYRAMKSNSTVYIHPSSSLFPDFINGQAPKCVCYYELVLTTKEYMRCVMACESKWLLELAPHYFKSSELEDLEKKKMPKAVGSAGMNGV